jgi:hypothetical protein
MKCLMTVLLWALLAARTPAAEPWRGVLLSSAAATPEEIARLKQDSFRAVVIVVSAGETAGLKSAAARVSDAGLELHYWFEIGRSPALAKTHPEWMASLQGHPEWRRFYPDLAKDREDEVVKAFPWVPVAYAESFNAHSNRVAQALVSLPKPAGIWLNDLQGPPSVCGCGHPLCRWTTDYGPKRTATSLGDEAAADFVRAIQVMSPTAQVIPVWATECEERDKDQLCGGVGCYGGRCWKDWTRQLVPLAEVAPTMGVLATYKQLLRDLPAYGSTAAWVGEAVRSFQSMPVKNGATAIPQNRLLAVVQGWDVTGDELAAQIDQATGAGAKGVLIAREPVAQSWEPRIVGLSVNR